MKKTTPTSSKKIQQRLGEVIKLGIDVHLSQYVVTMKVDGSVPMRPRRFTPDAFLAWVAETRARCDRMYSCYEAGAFGYCLHRKLDALSVINHVIRPVSWDEHGKRVKTDGPLKGAAKGVRSCTLHLSGARLMVKVPCGPEVAHGV